MLTPTLLPSHPDFLRGFQERRLQVQGSASRVSLAFYMLIRAGLVPRPITLIHLAPTLFTLLIFSLSLLAFSRGTYAWALLLVARPPVPPSPVCTAKPWPPSSPRPARTPFYEALILQRINRILPVTPSLRASSTRS